MVIKLKPQQRFGLVDLHHKQLYSVPAHHVHGTFPRLLLDSFPGSLIGMFPGSIPGLIPGSFPDQRFVPLLIHRPEYHLVLILTSVHGCSRLHVACSSDHTDLL